MLEFASCKRMHSQFCWQIAKTVAVGAAALLTGFQRSKLWFDAQCQVVTWDGALVHGRAGPGPHWEPKLKRRGQAKARVLGNSRSTDDGTLIANFHHAF
jgi:hypothetical protein